MPRHAIPSFFVFVLLVLPVPASWSQTGVTLTPDGLSHLASKDVGAERYSISLNVAEADTNKFVNATGNVFRRDGSAPSFIVCQIREDSVGTLTDPASVFRFRCKGTDACETTATECAQGSWREIPGGADVQLPASFFLPAGGIGAGVAAGFASASEATPDADGVSALLVAILGELPWSEAASSVAEVSPLHGSDVQGALAASGATLSLDGLNHLVSKDVGGSRWSISLNFAPELDERGQAGKRLVNATGNVFPLDGGAPSFVYCTVRGDSTGTLEDAGSEFRLACVGTDPCTTTASECARTQWRPIPGADDVRLAADFFLPPGGLPPVGTSDPDIVIIGRTSDPASVATSEFTLPGAGSATSETERAQGGVGTCFANRIGDCTMVPGELITGASGQALCLVEDVPSGCIKCGVGPTTGGCGRGCLFPVGTKTARGTCLPFDAFSADCLCNAVGAGSGPPASCGGPLAGTCPAGRCCADDPRDGCRPEDGDASCTGTCVGAGGCDPVTQECGFCVDPCGNGVAEGPEQCDGNDLRGATCASRGQGGGELGCRPSCTYDETRCAQCGNRIVEAGEECDGQSLGGATCESLGLPSGELSCGAGCSFDTSDCAGACETQAPCLTASVGPDGQCQFESSCPAGEACQCPNPSEGCDTSELLCLTADPVYACPPGATVLAPQTNTFFANLPRTYCVNIDRANRAIEFGLFSETPCTLTVAASGPPSSAGAIEASGVGAVTVVYFDPENSIPLGSYAFEGSIEGPCNPQVAVRLEVADGRP